MFLFYILAVEDTRENGSTEMTLCSGASSKPGDCKQCMNWHLVRYVTSFYRYISGYYENLCKKILRIE